MAQNYYEILGISKTATDDEIKKAYRRKAMEHHPDKHKGNKESEAKFKEINNAYEILSDRQKRASYDQFGEAGVNFGGGGGGFQGGQGFGSQGFDFNGFRADFGNGDSFSDIFEAFFNGFGGRNNAPRKGRNLEFELQISFEDAAFGTEKELIINRSKVNKEEHIKVKIPAGVDNGSVIRLSGKGEPGTNGGPSGDLYVYIAVGKHAVFTRNGADLLKNEEISVLQAILGAEIQVKTLDGELTLKIQPGTQPNQTIKLKGHGISKLNSTEKGDLLIKITVLIPTKLSKKEKEYFQELAEEQGLKAKGKGFWK